VSKDLVSIPLPDLKPSVESVPAPEVRWIDGCDKQPLACRVWRGQARQPVIVYLHGIEGHSQWFNNTAGVLNRRGISIYAPDRRGSGLNTRERGHLTSYKALLADIEIILRVVAKEHHGQPLVLVGNCWGGKPASVMACHDYSTTDGQSLPELAGLILTSPAIHTKVDFNWQTKLDIGYSTFKSDRRARETLAIPIEPSMFTDDATYLEFIKHDPLRLLQATKKFFFEQFLLTLKAKRAAAKLTLPTLLIESGKDEIVNVTELDRWYEKIQANDKSKRIFQEAAHSIEFDPLWFEDYCRLLGDWILARAPGAVA
jgi:acylglycerol lipase